MSELPLHIQKRPDLDSTENQKRPPLTREQAQRFGRITLGKSPSFPGDTHRLPKNSAPVDTANLATANILMDAYDAGRNSVTPSREVIATQIDEAWKNHHTNSNTEQAEIAYRQAEAETEETIIKSLKDGLTGLPNREALEEHVKKVGIEGLSGLAMIDLNDFKSVNDEFGGHRVGDEVLIEFAGILQEELADVGLPARTGGDEFAVALFKNAAPEKINQALLKIKQRTSAITKPRTAETSEKDTRQQWRAGASIGYIPSNKFQTIEEGLEMADKSMYTDKHRGQEFVPRSERRP